ncbi:LysR family transcriptional regulator [Roseococcus sp. DSY-14]|uniref:LysR family transcriptional regulator n=1 Tax=Roseococcus sp. DSY-14 TaxID=3369650 RepID=UPI00387A92F5
MLRVADALDAHGSLLKAAGVLGVTQPALSRSLRELEGVVGAPLFDRHPRGVRPTPAGVAVIRLARRILAELRRAEEELDAPGGALRVGVLPVAAVGVLPGALSRLRDAQPALRVTLREGRTEELLPLLLAREVDAVVGRLYAPAAPDGLLRLPLWEEPVRLLLRAGHPLARGRLTAARIARHPLALPTPTQRLGQEVAALAERLGLPAGAALRASSTGLIRELLLEGDTVSIMPASLMAGDLLRGALRALALPLEAPPRPAGVILPAGPPPGPAVAALLAALRAQAALLAPHGLGVMPEADTARPISDGTGRRRRA